AGLFAAPALPGERWRLTLARPLREPLALEGVCELPPAPVAGPSVAVEVPLLAVPGAERMEGEVRLYAAGVKLGPVQALGPPPPGARGVPPPAPVPRRGASSAPPPRPWPSPSTSRSPAWPTSRPR